jgi:hypothetical protein
MTPAAIPLLGLVTKHEHEMAATGIKTTRRARQIRGTGASSRRVQWPCRPGAGLDAPVEGFDEARRRIRLGAMMPDPRSGERALRSKFMLIFRGGAVARHDLSPSELQAHVEKWYRWSDELARQGRGNVGTALDNPGAAVRGHERVVTDGPYAESKDLVTGSMIFEAASLEDAVDVARTCPTYEFGGSVEVRPVQDPWI